MPIAAAMKGNVNTVHERGLYFSALLALFMFCTFYILFF